jgi:predicted Na+-dependent transporter
MGLGAGQRNIAAALVVAARDFNDPKTLVMVVLFSVLDLAVLFPIAWVLRRRSGRPRTPPAQQRHTRHDRAPMGQQHHWRAPS